jgi:HPt (histidine-containing phosphotransfer) domain-containing protein/HAMP domain-containing protein
VPPPRSLQNRLGLTLLSLICYLVVDLVFKVVVVTGCIDLTVGNDPAPRAQAIAWAIKSACVSVPAFLAFIVSRAWRMERALCELRRTLGQRDRSRTTTRAADDLRRVTRELHRLPQIAALAWMIQWQIYIGVLASRASALPLTAILFFMVAMTFGPLPLAHGIMLYILAPAIRGVSLAARAGGVELDGGPLRLRTRLAFYTISIAIAPTAFMASLVFSPHIQAMTYAHVLGTVGVFSFAVILFAFLAATLVSMTITRPVGEMAEVMSALTEQGDVSRVARLPVHRRDEVGRLAELTNRMLDRLESTAKDQVAAATSLEALNRTLEERVASRTAELSARTTEMRLVLDNVAEGLFAVDHSGAMTTGSKALVDWFGAPEPGEAFFRYLGRHNPGFGETAEIGWEQLAAGFLPMEVAIGQLPTRFRAGERHFCLSYQPIEGSSSQTILVVVTDDTANVRRETAEREKRETRAIFDHFLSERSVFLDFMEEGSSIITLTRPEETISDLIQLKRAIHTLKGNSLLFGLESVAELCHDVESALADNLPVDGLVGRLVERWKRLEDEVERIAGRQRHVIELSADDHVRLEQAIRENTPHVELARMVRDLTLEPVSIRLNHLAEQARRMGRRLDKPVQVNVIHDGVRLDTRRWSRLWSAIVHPVRNAIDHGIERPGERIRSAKPAEGQLILRTERRGEAVVLEIEDDGRGIGWDAIAAKCAAQGLPTRTPDDLIAALFADGVSTAAVLTDISGRGVGMGALRAAVEALGGVLDITTESGRGTRLRMSFPAAAA